MAQKRKVSVAGLAGESLQERRGVVVDRAKAIDILNRGTKPFRNFSHSRRNDRQVCFVAVQISPRNLAHVAPCLQDDAEIVSSAVGVDGDLLQHASVNLRGQKDVVLQAVKQKGTALKFASAELQGDYGVVIAALNRFSMLMATT